MLVLWAFAISKEMHSTAMRDEGKTYCHAHSRAAFGDFRLKANGRCTVPNPSSRSCSCCAFMRKRWRRNGSDRLSGNIVTRSLPALRVTHRDLCEREVDIL